MKQSKIVSILTLILICLSGTTARAAADADWKPQISIALPAKASGLSFSPDGGWIAVGHPDGRVSIWNVKTGESVRILDAHTKAVNTVQFMPAGDRLLTIGDDNRARLWSTSDWNEVGSIEGVAFSGGISPDGRWLAAQDPEQVIWIWDLTMLRQVKQLTETGKGGTQNMSFTADGKHLATAYNSPLLINIETMQNISFVSSGYKKTTMKIERGAGNQAAVSLGPLQEDGAPTHRAIPSRTGSFVALGRGWYGKSAFIDVWDMSTMKRLGRYKPDDAGTLTSFSFDNSLLAIEGAKKVVIWRIASGKQIAAVKGDGIMQFAPGSIALAVTDGTTLIIYVPK